MSSSPYLTVADFCEHEIPPIKGSRFIAFVAPVHDDGSAMTALSAIRVQYPDARHHCWAYQLREQQKTRFSDDGEPNGSAGKPILAPIVGRELMDTLVVVVRYFGGVKLGVGGLVRAYSQAANAVLEAAEIHTIVPKITLQLQYTYTQTSAVATALAILSLVERNAVYMDCITSELRIQPEDVEAVCRSLTDYTSGQIQLKILESFTFS